MAGRPVTLRSLALLAAAGLALHELRYALAPQAHAAEHGYLSWVMPLVATLVALAAGAYVLALARARAGAARPLTPPRFEAVWLAASAALAATYGMQETLEGIFAAGHPAGAVAAVAHGGWIGFALAPAVGALVALLLHGAHAVLARALRRPPAPRPSPPPLTRAQPSIFLPRDPLARHLAGRGPPLTG